VSSRKISPPGKRASAFTDRMLGLALLGQSALFYLMTGGYGLDQFIELRTDLLLTAGAAAGDVERLILPIAVATIGLLGFLIAWSRPGRFRTHLAVAVAQMSISALWVHLSGAGAGRAHAMVSLALVAAYANQRVLVFSAVIAVSHMLVVGLAIPSFDAGRFTPLWPWLEHGAYVLALSAALIFAVHRVRRTSVAGVVAQALDGAPPVGRLITRLQGPQREAQREGVTEDHDGAGEPARYPADGDIPLAGDERGSGDEPRSERRQDDAFSPHDSRTEDASRRGGSPSGDPYRARSDAADDPRARAG
jgi:hypothetical protein